MSIYTILTDWVGKDSLSDTDVNKVISGSDFQTEFEAIQTVINDKADSNDNATQTYVDTAITGHDTKANILLDVYPVGSVYTSVASTDPGTLFGGTWVSFGAGKVMVGINSSDTDFDTVEETGGRKDSVLPAHTHEYKYSDQTQVQLIGSTITTISEVDEGVSRRNTLSAGVTLTGNENLQPYIVVYMWKRTA